MGKHGKRISKEFISSVEPYGKTNLGWFYVKGGKLSDTLPGMSKILADLESEKIKKHLIKETNGYISFYLGGKAVKEFNYGDYVTKNVGLDFSGLTYGLYKLDKDIKVVAKDGNDIFKLKEGVFFIPAPGYGIINKYSKKQVLDAVDSTVLLVDVPKVVWIKADK